MTDTDLDISFLVFILNSLQFVIAILDYVMGMFSNLDWGFFFDNFSI